MSTGHVYELRCQQGTSNKFYRIYEVSNGGHYLVLNWGRWGATGQFKVEQHGGAASMQVAALTKRDAKLGRGYEQIRSQTLPVLPDDILGKIEELTGHRPDPTPAPTPGTPVAAVSVFDQFAADTDRLIRMVTSAPDLTAETVVLRSTLEQQLGELRARLEASEGQLELVNDVIAMKVGAG